MSFKQEIDMKEDTQQFEDVAVHEHETGIDPAKERALLRKLDLRIILPLFFCYILNYIDRTNIGNARIGGMAVDLKMSSTDYSTALSIFFVGYLLAELPSNMLLSRSRPSIFLPSLMIVWGCLTIAAVGVKSTGGLIALRFILGFVEAGFFPGVMFLMSCWYKPFELAKRLAMFYTASLCSGAFGGLLAGGIIGGMEGTGGLRGWKWLFALEGIATVIVAAIVIFILPDYPATTKWLTEEERELAILRLVDSHSTGEPKGHKDAIIAVLKNKKTYILTLAYMGITSAGTISYFFPTLMTSLGYKSTQANLMTAPIYMAVLVICICVGFSSDHFNEKPFHAIACCCFSAMSFIVLAVTPAKLTALKYTFITFGGAGIWSATPLALSYALQNYPVREERAAAVALINGFGNLASVYGSYIWPSTSAPRYITGFGCTTGFILVGAAAILTNRLIQGDLAKVSAEEVAANQAAVDAHRYAQKTERDE